MRNYVKGLLASNGIFIWFGKDYIKMTLLVQADRFRRSVSER